MKTFSPEEWENVPSNTANSNTSNTPSAYSNTSEDTRAKVERVLSLIEQKGIDITNGYDNWLKVGFALTSEFQEAGRGFFHRVSRQNPEYKASDTDKQYNKCLSAHGDGISIATFFRWRKMLVLTFPIPKKSKSHPLEFRIFGLMVLTTKYPKTKYPAYRSGLQMDFG